MKNNVFETQRLLLLPPHPSLAGKAARFTVRNREFLQPFEPLHPEEYFTTAFQKKRMKQDLLDCKEGRALRFWVFLKNKPHIAVGTVGLTNIVMGSFCSCFIGYSIDKVCQNRGYASEAIAKVCEIGFEGLGLHRIEANIMPHNTPSLRVAQKLGFQPEGMSPKYLSINGNWEDHVRLALLNPAWIPPKEKK